MKKEKILLAMLLCVVLALPMMPFFSTKAFAEDIDKLPKPENVKVTVTDMKQGTMSLFGQNNLTGTIVSLSVSLNKVNGANLYFVGPVKRVSNPGSNTAYFAKAGSGQMPYIKANPGQKATFDDGGEPGPNGDITV